MREKRTLNKYNPELLKEWNYDKNKELDINPDDVTIGMSTRVWWKCSCCGYEWQTRVSHRTQNRTRCPECSKKECIRKRHEKELHEKGNLSELYPEIVKDWDYVKNNEFGIKPEECLPGQSTNVYWKCNKCSFEWKTRISHRTLDKTNCPNCSKLDKMNDIVKERGTFIEKQPELLKEWCYEKNEGLLPENFTEGSNKSVWWKCSECGYVWRASIVNRIKGTGCAKCAVKKGKKTLLGNQIKERGSFIENSPELARYWHPTRNGELTADKVMLQSNNIVWWKCIECGFEWENKISDQAKRKNICQKCAVIKSSKNLLLIKGVNDLKTRHPKLVREWNYEKNINIQPDEVMEYSNKSVWWKCEKCDNEWRALIGSGVNGRGCPACAQAVREIQYRKTMVDKNGSLMEKRPELMAQWDYDKNEITPDNVSCGSHIKVWWKCEKKHSYQETIKHRTLANTGCPICSNHQVLSGYNDMKTYALNNGFEYLIEEWDNENNEDITLDKIAPYSNKYYSWRCKEGHEFKSTAARRSRGDFCPVCSKEFKISYPEKVLYYYLRSIFLDAKENIRRSELSWLKALELDIFIPSISLAIEYDGEAWHKNIVKDNLKNDICKDNNVTLLRVREPKCPELNNNAVIFTLDKVDDELALKRIMFQINDYINNRYGFSNNLDINFSRDRKAIYNMMVFSKKENSLSTKKPKLAKEFHPTANGKLTPDKLSIGSGRKVWWLGKCGHAWEANVSNRVNGTGCPYCSNVAIKKGFNDFETYCRSNNLDCLLEEWCYEKNIINPNQIIFGSNKLVYWEHQKKDLKGNLCRHIWKQSVYNRIKGQSCSICAGKTLLVGFNDLSSQFPQLVKEWDYERNIDLFPDKVLYNKNQAAYWKCSVCGHEWKQSINARTVYRKECPICSRKKDRERKLVQDLERYGSLAEKYPKLANEFLGDRNGGIGVDRMPCNSKKRWWWKCSCCARAFKATIYERLTNNLDEKSN